MPVRDITTTLCSWEFMNLGFIIAYVFSVNILKNWITYTRKSCNVSFLRRVAWENKTYGSSSGKRTLKISDRHLTWKGQLKIKGSGSFWKNSDGLFSVSQMKCLQKFGGCDYKDITRNLLNKLFSWKMTSEKNPERQQQKNWHQNLLLVSYLFTKNLSKSFFCHSSF